MTKSEIQIYIHTTNNDIITRKINKPKFSYSI